MPLLITIVTPLLFSLAVTLMLSHFAMLAAVTFADCFRHFHYAAADEAPRHAILS
jgi:hypothetical protein